MNSLFRPTFLGVALALATAPLPSFAQLYEYSGNGDFVSVEGSAPSFIGFDTEVDFTFVFDVSTPANLLTATYAEYVGLYGWVTFDGTHTEVLFDVDMFIVRSPGTAEYPYPDYNYTLRGTTVDGWEFSHFAYSRDSAFVPSLDLPTATPPWSDEDPPAGYIYATASNWLAYSDADFWFQVNPASPAPGAPTIVDQPDSVSVKPGKPAHFKVRASGEAPLSYQWLKNGQPIASETSRMLKIKKTSAESPAEYRVLVSNDSGTVLSDTAALTFR